MKIEVGEEISLEEYLELPDRQRTYFFGAGDDKARYFKKAQKFPIVLEDDKVEFKIDADGFFMKDKRTEEGIYLWFNKNFPLLRQAIKKIDELKLADKEENKNEN